MNTYSQFFAKATALNEPYGYQCRLACGPSARPDLNDTLLGGMECQSQIIEVPTGLGKTAAVILAWIWNRLVVSDPDGRARWPRRLVYCLPMRTLVEQTRENVVRWLSNLGLSDSVGVHILMGGEEAGEWDIYPEREVIIIGTQDMLLSRALNRGYGMSRYRWPIHFALLNNDCLWVFDEIQLMGVAVETSAQLNGFRRRAEWSPELKCATWWMSATLDASRLGTVDHPEPSGGWSRIALSEQERHSGELKARYEGHKPLFRTTIVLSSAEKKNYARQIAALVSEKHRRGTLTLVVVNRVFRAQEVYAALRDPKLKLDPACLALIHSRFRLGDRQRHAEILRRGGDRIVVATQAVEAGVDVSARLIVTELAPWPSLVQRFGRCNRNGRDSDAEVLWIDIQAKDHKDDACLPYAYDELEKARKALAGIVDVSPKFLEEVRVSSVDIIRPVIRHRDLVDLFDTTPDLCGQDLDISRYIRDGDDTDVQFFWRSVGLETPEEESHCFDRLELCRVSLGDAAKFLKRNTTRAWRWNPLGEKWEKATRPRSGAIYLIDVACGGYSDDLGWTGDPKDVLVHNPAASGRMEGYGRDADSFLHVWQTLEDHTAAVVLAASTLARDLDLAPHTAQALVSAARWHDVGKAHEQFQNMLCASEPARTGTLWAKSSNAGGRRARPGFRHELASALAWLLGGNKDDPERDLVAYLVAAHHGKVRLSIRALPDEKGPPEELDKPYARGIWDGDTLPALRLGSLVTPPITLDLGIMHMGTGPHGESWLSRMISLRDLLGPFRLAYLEALLRAADAKGSKA
jgi:CRISPR-associated endonuclease/helicase Cas3